MTRFVLKEINEEGERTTLDKLDKRHKIFDSINKFIMKDYEANKVSAGYEFDKEDKHRLRVRDHYKHISLRNIIGSPVLRTTRSMIRKESQNL